MTISFSGDELTVLLKCIKASVDVREPLKESMRADACKLYDRINNEWQR